MLHQITKGVHLCTIGGKRQDVGLPEIFFFTFLSWTSRFVGSPFEDSG